MSSPVQISDNNLSLAWLKALDMAFDNPRSPLCVSVSSLENGINEDMSIRKQLDDILKERNEASIRETSETLFPYQYWAAARPSCADLSLWYTNRYLPKHRARIKKVRPNTPRETYFERLVAYSGFHKTGNGIERIRINQLERIIAVFKHYNPMGKNPSPSKYIATCLNPSVDNTNLGPYVPFPCLQQIGFSFKGGSITVNAFYTVQYLMKRGYGNYLGLCYLGQFMSHETGLPLSQVNCFIGNPYIDGISKSSFKQGFDKFLV